MSQIPLPFDFGSDNKFREEDFCLTSQNSPCFNSLAKFFDQESFDIPSIIVKGPKYSGKTHMLNILAQKYNAEFLTDIDNLDFIGHFKRNQFYILEDIEKTDENSLFHLLNAAYESCAFLILSTNQDLNFKLKDLISRLRNIYIAKIEDLSLDSTRILLLNYFSRKQIKLSNKIIDYIANNCQLNYKMLLDLAKRVEMYSLESQKSATLKDVKKIIF